jgi:hypothetical protein
MMATFPAEDAPPVRVVPAPAREDEGPVECDIARHDRAFQAVGDQLA